MKTNKTSLYIKFICIAFFLNINHVSAQTLLSEGFEGTFPPAGWSLYTGGWGQTGSSPQSGNYAMYGGIAYNGANTDDWAFTPALPMIAGERYRISYYYRLADNYYANNESFEVTIGSAAAPASQTTVLHNYPYNTFTNANYLQGVDYYIAPVTGNNYLAFNASTTNNIFSDGMVIDNVVVEQMPDCTGTPVLSAVSGSASAVCYLDTLTLSLTGDYTASGLNLQWQSSPMGANNFSDIAGATTSVLITQQSTPLDYRCAATCALSNSATVYSNTYSVAIKPQCYYSPTAYCNYNYISNVSISNLNNSSGCTYITGYTYYNALPPVALYRGLKIPIQVQANSADVAVWVDFNNNGVFDTTEYTNLGTADATGNVYGYINVPANAALATTRMRVRSVPYFDFTSKNADTSSFFYGEIEDYNVSISDLTACTSTPTGGTASSTLSVVCPLTPFTLSVSGSSINGQYPSYQWQSSIDGNSWNDISGAIGNMPIMTITQTNATYYRREIFCNNSLFAYSSAVVVAESPLNTCYCTPGASICDVPYKIDSVLFSNMAITTGACSSNGYTSNINGAVPIIHAGTYQNLILRAGNGSSSMQVMCFIDFNHDGSFDGTDEVFDLGSTSGSSIRLNKYIRIPFSALAGDTYMRIRSSSNINTYTSCSTESYGETEDYKVTILPPPPGVAGFVFYVNANATGLNNGTTWNDAFTNLSAAITAAKAKDTIKIAKGIYTYGGQYSLSDGSVILGGYPNSGNPTDADRNWSINQTIINGNQQAGTIFSGVNLGSATILDGLIIENGFDNGASQSSNGVALSLTSSNPIIRNCVFRNNTNHNAFVLDEASSILCNNCGASISDCFFVNNNGYGGSADINCFGGSNASVTNCVFAGDNDGKIIRAENSNLQITNCTFFNDSTSSQYITPDKEGVVSASSGSNLIINNSIFFSNKYDNGQSYTTDSSDIALTNATLLMSNTITQVYQPLDHSFFGLNPKFKDTSSVTGPDGFYFTADDGLQLNNPGSKAINNGSNNAVTGITTDINGNPRIYGTTVDLGAYELQSAALPTPAVLYVNTTATGANNGTSWANAFPDLQKALGATSDTIKIAAGTYYPSTADPDIAFWLEKKRVLLGGYPNTGNPSDALRNPAINPTVFSGILPSGNGAQSYVIVKGNAVDSTAVLDGVTISGSRSGYSNEGAAIYLTNNASAIIRNSILTGNTTGNNAAALEIRYSSNPTFLNCTFSHNGSSGDNTLDNGAIYISDSCNPVFRKCIFSGNTTEMDGGVPSLGTGGAMINNNNSNPIIDSCTFFKNTANASAAGIANYNNSNPVITNTGFYGNSTGDKSILNNGSATDMLNDNSSPQLSNCIFSDSAAAYQGGAILNQNNSNPVFTNCSFRNGSAGEGGSCYNDHSNPTFNKCLFANCSATYGGVMYNTNYSSPSIINCVATDNNSFMYNIKSAPLIISSTIANGAAITNTDSTTLTIQNSVYESISDAANSTTPSTITSSIQTIVARFVDSTNAAGPDHIFFTNDDGLELCTCSPAINAGNNALAAGINTDVVNNQRIKNGTIDIGAYEYQGNALASQKTFYVSASATGGNDGSSWANAYTNLQSALLNTCADTIKVATGTYKPAFISRDSSFYPHRPVVLFGGYPNIGNPADTLRNTDAYPTILSGDVGVQGDSTDNTYVLMTLADSSLVDGFIFTSANNNQPINNGSVPPGGALVVNGAVRNCRFMNNTSLSFGSAVYGKADISNSVFYNNNGDWSTVYSPDSIRNCVFMSNRSTAYGGAVYTTVGTVMENSIFYGNYSQEGGGGVYLDFNPPAKITNCDFVRNNSLNGSGVGLTNYNEFVAYASGPVINNCIFQENMYRGSYSGYQNSDWNWGSGSNPNYSNGLDLNYSAIITSVPYNNTNILSGGIIFKNIDNPAGPDGLWFTKDDGLQLDGASTGRDDANNASVTTILTDIQGNPRIFNSIVDMGAYEYNGVSAGPDISICVGTGAGKQIGSTPNAILTYSWTSIPAGFTSNISNPIVNPLVTTTYCLSATDGIAVYTDTAIVNVIPPPLAYAGNDTTICMGDSITLGSTANNNSSGYNWTNNPFSFSESTISPTIKVQPLVTSSYYLTVTNAGCSSEDTVNITVNSVPPTNAGPDTTICPGDSIIIGPTTTGAIGYAWTSSPAGFSSSQANPTIKPTALSTNYYLVVNNGIGVCPSKDTVVISVPFIPMGVAGNDTSICAGNGTMIGYPLISSAYAYNWISNPAGFSSTTPDPTVSPATTTEYILALSKGVCTIEDSTLVTIDTNHIIADAGPDQNTCGTQDITVGNNPLNNMVTYDWESQSGFVSALPNPIVHVTTTGSYYLSVTDGTCISKDTMLVNVYPNPIVDIGDTLLDVCIGSSINIGGSNQTEYSYQWSSSPSGFISSTSQIEVSPTVTTIYYLTVTDNSSECKNIGQVRVIADSCFSDNIVVYPNPVTGNEIHIYVDATIQQQLYFQIINEYGALMLNASIPNNFILNISNIPSGAYFYKVLTASGQKLKSGVLVITH